MFEIGLLTEEARSLYTIFNSFFYAMVTVFILIGVLVEYFRFPLGGLPSFGVLVGRAVVAILLLNAHVEIINLLSEFTDSVSQQIGGFNNIFRLLKPASSWSQNRDHLIFLISGQKR